MVRAAGEGVLIQLDVGVLAAADVLTRDNAWALLESLRIDTGIFGPFGNHP
ncbi:hypothetical protein [Streptomyces adustus]|uniref:hypothetical protein n=1 Tax=Streptomyces adustus TaxID=1609272 RepID=UPI0012E0684E|nr:hypothetical protein [Streptomyces adustus]